MSTRPDLDRSISAWLEGEAPDRAPDRLLAAARDRLRETRQRRPWWPAGRTSSMNAYVKLAIGAATVVAVAVVGFNLLGPRISSGVAGPAASPSPSLTPTPTPSPTSSLEPLPTAAPVSDIFTSDPIPVGTYPITYDGLPMSVTVPVTGWKGEQGNSIGKGDYDTGAYAGIDFWLNSPDNVYSDPCAHTPLDPKPNATAADLAAAAATIPGTTVVSGPTSIELGGHPAQYLELTIDQDLACDPHDAWLWYDDRAGGPTGGWRWAEGLGATYRLWIADVDGKVVFIDGFTLADTAPGLDSELRDIVGSVTFD